ncbi:hypothetical protein [Paenarthrobacter ureafaciens]|uniref:hypothetical protein n=1 Tax=Paenarthrobacter ureafaciens TaxID=37931 RepID=UPI002DBC8FA1|nr:hypothetical protein [Paenarthrobacter ureafaciens]MEC3853903.1 hypothetical protein [Paenarthrobacter ureafaciens]
MTSTGSEDNTSTPLQWLVHAVVASYADASVAHLLNPDEERRAREGLPPEFFGWLVIEAEETVSVVRSLNAGDSRVPYTEVARASSRVLTELALRLMYGSPPRQFLVTSNRFAGQAARLGVDAAVVVQSMRLMERRWVDQLLTAATDQAAAVAPTILATSSAV